MMLLGFIGSRFCEAGMRELAVQIDVVAEGSMEKVIGGNHYNRAVRRHKTVYEELMRVVIQMSQTPVCSTKRNIKLDIGPNEFERVICIAMNFPSERANLMSMYWTSRRRAQT